MMKIIVEILLYLFWGVFYAIDFFYLAYEEMVENEGMHVGEFFGLTILTAIFWPICIIIFAIFDLRNER